MIRTKWTSIPVVRVVKLIRILEAVPVKTTDMIYEIKILRKLIALGDDE